MAPKPPAPRTPANPRTPHTSRPLQQCTLLPTRPPAAGWPCPRSMAARWSGARAAAGCAPPPRRAKRCRWRRRPTRWPPASCPVEDAIQLFHVDTGTRHLEGTLVQHASLPPRLALIHPAPAPFPGHHRLTSWNAWRSLMLRLSISLPSLLARSVYTPRLRAVGTGAQLLGARQLSPQHSIICCDIINQVQITCITVPSQWAAA